MAKSLILIGYMGCGKTVLGKCLAKRKSLDFIDLDEFIETEENTSISKIFEKVGELGFRKKERFYLEKLLSQNLRAIISLGGGTPCYFDNINYVIKKDRFQSVYLKTSPKILASRLFEERNHRPIISHLDTPEDLEEFISKHLFERVPFYIMAEYHISTNDRSIEDLVDQLEKLLT